MAESEIADVAVGIDLGTSNSCVSFARGSEIEVLSNAYGENTTASVVNLGADGSITVGNAAKANIIHDPTNTIYSAKRLIGRYFFSEEVKKARAICSYEIIEGESHSVRIKVREENFSLPEVGAMVLRELKSIAEAKLGQQVDKAVITVPAYFNDNQRQATRDAGRIAGLEVLRILNEPTAAALAYGFGRNLQQKVAVYDLGGGTFDISVLEIGNDVFEVLSSSGDTFLGGDDFDDRVIDLLADEFQASQNINLRNDPYALEKLKVAAEDCKKAFSVEDEAEIRIPDVITAPDGTSHSIERRIDKTEFWSLVQDLVMRTLKVCDEALQAANVVARDLDGVILVGGPTRLPAIREAVAEYFQQEPRDGVDPDEVVAKGAAIHAASFVEEDTDAYLLDVTPLSLQVGVAGGLCEPIIERNTPVPIEQSRSFTTARDGQKLVKIKVYQGESREASDNALLGQFEFSGFEPAKRGQVAIDVAFQINTDGIVNVMASDRATGQQASTSITLSSGLSQTELERIEQRGVTERVRTETAPAEAAAAAVGTPASPAEPAVPLADEPELPKMPPAAAAEPAPTPAPDLAQDELEIDEEDLIDGATPSLEEDLAEPIAAVASAEVDALEAEEDDAIVPMVEELDASTPPPGDDEPDSLFGDGSADLTEEDPEVVLQPTLDAVSTEEVNTRPEVEIDLDLECETRVEAAQTHPTFGGAASDELGGEDSEIVDLVGGVDVVRLEPEEGQADGDGEPELDLGSIEELDDSAILLDDAPTDDSEPDPDTH